MPILSVTFAAIQPTPLVQSEQSPYGAPYFSTSLFGQGLAKDVVQFGGDSSLRIRSL